MLLRTDILQKTVNSQQLRIFYAPFSSTGWINSRDNAQDASYVLHILTSNDSKLHLLSTLQYEFFWAWPDKPQNKFKWRYDRRSGNCNLSNCKSPHPPPPKIQDLNDFNEIRTYGLLPLVRTPLKPRNFFAFICNCLNAVTTVTIMYSLKLMYFHSSNHIQTLLKQKQKAKRIRPRFESGQVWLFSSRKAEKENEEIFLYGRCMLRSRTKITGKNFP